MSILKPTTEQVQYYLDRWDSLENYVLQENSLRKLFTKLCPRNKEMDDILIKVCALNDFYSTNIFSPFKVAKHIVTLDIDQRLKNNDLSLINDIAVVDMGNTKTINFYSFATKYCSHHYPESYPIYDSFVEKILLHFKKSDKFAKFKTKELKHYPSFHDILLQFMAFYGLNGFSLKQIDKYLWQIGKEYFPKKYK